MGHFCSCFPLPHADSSPSSPCVSAAEIRNAPTLSDSLPIRTHITVTSPSRVVHYRLQIADAANLYSAPSFLLRPRARVQIFMCDSSFNYVENLSRRRGQDDGFPSSFPIRVLVSITVDGHRSPPSSVSFLWICITVASGFCWRGGCEPGFGGHVRKLGRKIPAITALHPLPGLHRNH